MTPRRSRHLDSTSLRRSVGTRAPRKVIVVFMEGEQTEPQYLQGLRGSGAVTRAASVEIRLEQGAAVAYPLITRAVTRKQTDEARGLEADEYGCVMDVEAPVPHPRLIEALEFARRHGVRVAASNPCFELWLILHFADQGAWLTSADAQQRRRELDGGQGKALSWARYEPLVGDALRRARLLAERHRRDESMCPSDNPSSTMPDLLDAIGWPAG